MSAKKKSEKEKEGAEEAGKALTPLERAATIVSALLVAFLLSVLIWDAIHPNTPAAFTARKIKIEERETGYRTEIEVANTGDDAAKSVMVHVEMIGADTTLAETDLTIDWLPGRSKHVVVGFWPKLHGNVLDVKAEVRGYSEP
ncbi:MAG TPA: hypothetical protein VM099_14005 [Gemmatimonadaceae bacterium]|nr:hypothetical protein [Gemmatimonadaceae bacterium]